jgi:hypothetical protein
LHQIFNKIRAICLKSEIFLQKNLPGKKAVGPTNPYVPTVFRFFGFFLWLNFGESRFV